MFIIDRQKFGGLTETSKMLTRKEVVTISSLYWRWDYRFLITITEEDKGQRQETQDIIVIY